MRLTINRLRRQAIASTLFTPTSLRRAIDRLGFVQADPIRSPARAQDLILRLRVKNYHAGDLESRYPALGIEEDFLYAYGFMPQSTWSLLHPRITRKSTNIESKVLAIVEAHQRIHPSELESFLGAKREINAWGGYSKATTRALEALHYRGLLRIAGRKNGVRLYEATSKKSDLLDPDERLRRLTLLIAAILAPAPERSLRATLRHLAYSAPGLQGRRSAVTKLLDTGDLVRETVEGLHYVWAPGKLSHNEPEDKVRFLAPFDPLVWDRQRFQHLWNWSYRFEAYTPAPKRKLGYYAMPVLWRDDIVGWVNVSYKAGHVTINEGFAKEPVTDPAFRREFNTEVERMQSFLRPPSELS